MTNAYTATVELEMTTYGSDKETARKLLQEKLESKLKHDGTQRYEPDLVSAKFPEVIKEKTTGEGDELVRRADLPQQWKCTSCLETFYWEGESPGCPSCAATPNHVEKASVEKGSGDGDSSTSATGNGSRPETVADADPNASANNNAGVEPPKSSDTKEKNAEGDSGSE